jgi:hypothetical protein
VPVENPYVSAASGAAGAAESNFGAALRYVTALRAAADQQRKLQQQQDFEYRKETRDLQEKGYIPTENITVTPMVPAGRAMTDSRPGWAGTSPPAVVN